MCVSAADVFLVAESLCGGVVTLQRVRNTAGMWAVVLLWGLYLVGAVGVLRADMRRRCMRLNCVEV